jgi:trigger factor
MQINALRTEGLVHEYQVTVAAGDIQRQVETRLKGLVYKVDIPGFRKGKVPVQVIEKRYGPAVLSEVVEETVNTATMKAVSEKGLKPALEPKVELSDSPSELPANKDLVFTMKVEVIPEMPATDFSKITLEKLVAEASEKDIHEALENIASSNRTSQPAADDYVAQKGDAVIIDFDGSVDGERRPGMKSENHALELGSGQFIPGFEEQLMGTKKGDQRQVKVTFPSQYHAADLAGKEAVFAVTVKSVNTLAKPALDDELGKAVGLESLEALKNHIKERIAENFGQVSRMVIKRELMDKLAEQYKFSVPPTLVEREMEGLWHQAQHAHDHEHGDHGHDHAHHDANLHHGHDHKNEQEKTSCEEKMRKEYEGISERRVRLGLLLSDIARKNKIEVNREDARRAIMQEAMRYPNQQKQVVEYFTKNAAARDQLTAPMLEEKVVDYILSQAKLTEKKVSREELQKAAEAED